MAWRLLGQRAIQRGEVNRAEGGGGGDWLAGRSVAQCVLGPDGWPDLLPAISIVGWGEAISLAGAREPTPTSRQVQMVFLQLPRPLVAPMHSVAHVPRPWRLALLTTAVRRLEAVRSTMSCSGCACALVLVVCQLALPLVALVV